MMQWIQWVSFISEKHGIIFICKSVTDQFSHRCLHKITEFNQTAKNLNCSHGSCLISDHKQLKQFSVGFVPEPPFCIIVPKRNQKIIPQHWAQWPIELVSVAHLITLSQYIFWVTWLKGSLILELVAFLIMSQLILIVERFTCLQTCVHSWKFLFIFFFLRHFKKWRSIPQ